MGDDTATSIAEVGSHGRESEATAVRLAANGSHGTVERVPGMLAAQPEAVALLRAQSGPTTSDAHSGLNRARARLTDSPNTDESAFVSPLEFYREALQREDVRRILAALAQ